MMSGRTWEPLKARHRFSADCINLKAIVRHAVRLPLSLVCFVHKRTVAKVLSMGLVVSKCFQYSAGKS